VLSAFRSNSAETSCDPRRLEQVVEVGPSDADDAGATFTARSWPSAMSSRVKRSVTASSSAASGPSTA